MPNCDVHSPTVQSFRKKQSQCDFYTLVSFKFGHLLVQVYLVSFLAFCMFVQQLHALNTQGDNDVICYYSLWSVLPTPSCRATNRKLRYRFVI